MPFILDTFFSEFGTGHERFLQENEQEQQKTNEDPGPINVQLFLKGDEGLDRAPDPHTDESSYYRAESTG
ncbi:MAG: hypothetical protein JRF56_17420 [Deltaproteobacteria bacterium]|nr:hypothetical protein [Deltaproteobacteria bacterium]